MAKLYLGTTEITPALMVDKNKYGATVDSFIGDVNEFGVLQKPSKSTQLSFTGITNIAPEALMYKFRMNFQLTSVSLEDLVQLTGAVGYNCYQAFRNCINLTNINIFNLVTISSDNACTEMFFNTGITTANLVSLKTVSGDNACEGMFGSCIALETINVDNLEEITGTEALKDFCKGCNKVTSFDFKKLKTVSGSKAFLGAFNTCPRLANIYFRALTTTSFGGYTNQFDGMFNNNTAATSGNVVVHFPSNLQSTIQGLDGYSSRFGGSYGYVTFTYDLPATE